METLMYITFGLTVFLFLMFIGINARLSTVEIVLAGLIDAKEKQEKSIEDFREVTEKVSEYHDHMDVWATSIEKRVDHVESTTESRT